MVVLTDDQCCHHTGRYAHPEGASLRLIEPQDGLIASQQVARNVSCVDMSVAVFSRHHHEMCGADGELEDQTALACIIEVYQTTNLGGGVGTVAADKNVVFVQVSVDLT
ncbi:hypothetical protein ElyMa_000626500 [Elysia marginata]|uniref:Uncharacterized protein n=1 Tax=Elysia marginata TaxID=1093978 RepID=A0AAV4GA02_9GAST|nr:hypothetical protein ElyMa_000626500 [Elysia marginata]